MHLSPSIAHQLVSWSMQLICPILLLPLSLAQGLPDKIRASGGVDGEYVARVESGSHGIYRFVRDDGSLLY